MNHGAIFSNDKRHNHMNDSSISEGSKVDR